MEMFGYFEKTISDCYDSKGIKRKSDNDGSGVLTELSIDLVVGVMRTLLYAVINSILLIPKLFYLYVMFWNYATNRFWKIIKMDYSFKALFQMFVLSGQFVMFHLLLERCAYFLYLPISKFIVLSLRVLLILFGKGTR
ncbi:Hypothetical protein CINCED_3A007176 [Cinara cedri]|uniref:Uncharacterized protein n=1 Tax=Cinara cedri TaxID=506608 RepID=A0A5E4M8U5_9HEMI|nr:Hypothetical protein CINCED_3A007176 [Cinara cedri]